MTKKKLKIMVSSTVYHFKTEIEQLCSTLHGYGYLVLNSHIGTVYNIPGKSPLESCLAAVEECDFFFGIILPFYGSGITHTEIQKAIIINKPRGFLVHHDVAFARQLLHKFMVDSKGKRNEVVNEVINDAATNMIKLRLIEILRFINANKGTKVSDLITRFNVSERTIRDNIKILIDFNLVNYIGSKKAGAYELSNKMQDKLRDKLHN
ncbi:MAG: DUF4062 domain-containing protein [Bacteroidetes bacterium]|nr:DUF4062 domain-containing protein [Bacteroidota bacterium]